jgi:MFS-type transporter involved in bile tolerance (Atg22 family)
MEAIAMTSAADKKPSKSKKFIAFFFSMLLIASILVIALMTQSFVWSMSLFMAIGIMAIAFIAIGYVLSQSALDKFIHGVEHLSGTQYGNNEESEEYIEEPDNDFDDLLE